MPVIDFHTHVLPHLDDGSKSVEESLAMLYAESEQGIEHVVATPHFYPSRDNPERFLENRLKSKTLLLEAMSGERGLPKLSVGAEIYFFEGISDCEYLREMAIEGTDCVMIEMPMSHWSERNLAELCEIKQKQKLTPILAHVDRYVTPFTAKKKISALSKLPVILQVNTRFFTDRSTKRRAFSLLRDGHIQLIGSDCHNTDTRKPDIGSAIFAIRKTLGDNAISYIEHSQRKIFCK